MELRMRVPTVQDANDLEGKRPPRRATKVRATIPCPVCPYVIRAPQDQTTLPGVGEPQPEDPLRLAAVRHFTSAHRDVSADGKRALIDRLFDQDDIKDPPAPAEPPRPTAWFACPAGCGTILKTWMDQGRGRYVSADAAARHKGRQHLTKMHPGLGARERALLLDQIVIIVSEMEAPR